MITALKVEYVGPQKARVDLVGSASDVAGDIPKVWGDCDVANGSTIVGMDGSLRMFDEEGDSWQVILTGGEEG